MPGLGADAVLHDRYQVLRAVGRGGMGAVYEAIDLRLRHTVAVKKMTAGGSEADVAFEREARLLAALRFQALPVVIDYFLQDNSRFLVMQYIEGEDLGARLRRSGPCAETDAIRWGSAVLEALIYLHGHEPPIVHRDIKPSNIKLTPRGEIVLLDFGLAKGRVDSLSTEAGDDASIFGFTPSYAPPEQLEARGTDPRSDLYALGATIYHLVTGAAPPTAGDRALALAGGRSDPLIVKAAGLSASLAAVLDRALQLDAGRRFQSAAEMLAALTRNQPSAMPAPQSRAPAGVRRLDAAAPSRAEVGRPIDVIVQVRFAESPRLGLEDWPTKRRPAQIEQASDALQIEYPRDPVTGRALPARLRVVLVAPDFDIRGPAERLIDVPPDDYSPRLAFLLAPRQAGFCRVNVEVYAAADVLYLGAIPLETEALTERPSDEDVRAATLVLGVATAAVGDDPRAPIPSMPHVVAESNATVITGSASAASDNTQQRSRYRLPAWAPAAAMFAVALTSVVVWRSAPSLDTPVTSAAPPVSDVPPPPSAASSPAPGTVLPGSAPPAPAPPAMPPPGAVAPPSLPSATEAPVDAGSPRPTVPPITATVRSTSHPDVTLRLDQVTRVAAAAVRLAIVVVNASPAPVAVAFDARACRLDDAQGKNYGGIAASGGTWSATVQPAATANLQLDFAVPDAVDGVVRVTLVTPSSAGDLPRFPPLQFSLAPASR